MLPLSRAEPCSAYKVDNLARKHGFRDGDNNPQAPFDKGDGRVDPALPMLQVFAAHTHTHLP